MRQRAHAINSAAGCFVLSRRPSQMGGSETGKLYAHLLFYFMVFN